MKFFQQLWQSFKIFLVLVLLAIIYFALTPYFDEDAFWAFVNKYFFLLLFLGTFLYTIIIIALGDMENRRRANDASGEYYENLVAKKVCKIFKNKPLRSVLIPTPKGTTTEADILMVTQKGIFCIECKYHWHNLAYNNVSILDNEWQFGDEPATNPFMQNSYHIRNLKKYLADENIPVHNIVISSAGLENVRDEQGNIRYTSKKNHYQCLFKTGLYIKMTAKTRNKMPQYIRELPNVLTANQVAEITNKLKLLCGNKQQRHEHATRIQWETIKNILPELMVYLIQDKKTGEIVSASKLNAVKQIKLYKDIRHKKYTILDMQYLSVELENQYTVKAMIKSAENPAYIYKEKDIRQVRANIKDVYITGCDILTYKEAMKHPVFKQKNAIIGIICDETYAHFLCNIKQVQAPPEEYLAYLPELQKKY